MADIIDLDFYRKFRVVLPIRPSTLLKNKNNRRSGLVAKKYRKRRKDENPEKVKVKE